MKDLKLDMNDLPEHLEVQMLKEVVQTLCLSVSNADQFGVLYGKAFTDYVEVMSSRSTFYVIVLHNDNAF